MITKEEIRQKNLKIAGQETQNGFIISLISSREAQKNMFLTIDIENLLNRNLILGNYTNNAINSLIITSIPPFDDEGVNWRERKYFKRNEKKLLIDICFSDYYKFCSANQNDALILMAKQTLIAIEKYVSQIKEINYQSFYEDLVNLFKINGLIN